jgi:thioredoxin 1
MSNATSEVKQLTDADDHNAMVDSSTVPVLLDFYANWCPPCRALAPHVESLAKQMKGKVTVFKINVDENDGLALKYNVSSMPTLVLVVPGGKQVRHVGPKSLQQLTTWVTDNSK